MADQPPIKASGNWAWPASFAVVALALVAAVFIFLDRGCSKVSDGVQSIASAFKSSVNVTTILSSSAERLRKEAKLVVLSAEVSVEIRKDSEKVQEFMGYAFDFGTTSVRVRAPGNKIQFVVPLDKLSAEHFDFDAVHQRINVRIPTPVVDEQLVEVQSDPTKIECETKVGWARLESRSGKLMREQALRELREAVVREGRSDLYTEKAKANATEAVLKLLQPVTSELKDGVEVRVIFEEPKKR